MVLLHIKDFSCYYKIKKQGYAVALDNISLDVENGEFLVVVGPSGCGKTTLLKCILGLSQHTDGELLLAGKPVGTNVKELNIAYVSQEYSLYPQMTVFDNIAFPLRMMHTPYQEVERRVKEIADTLEIGWLLSRKPRQLSGGQHQRVAIARALVKNPRLVLFDEPFSNLDPELRLEMRKLIKNLHSAQKPTFVFVTHDLAEAFFLAERIVVMQRGEIVEQGSPEDLEKDHKSDLLRGFFGE